MRYFIGFLITIGLLILLIVLLAGGGGNKTQVPKSRTLYSYAFTPSEVRLTIDGPINAEQTHQQIRISVNQSQVVYEQIQGYDNTVQVSKTFPNTQSAYANFLKALNMVGFTRGISSQALQDQRGYCPTGTRYSYDLYDNGSKVQHYWSTSCGKPRTYNGSPAATNTLFEAQVPGYNQLAQQYQTNIY